MDGEAHRALSPEDDWFAAVVEEPVEGEAPAWQDEAVQPREPSPPDLGRRQVAVVLAVLVAVALVAAVILGARALTGSDDRTTTTATTTPTGASTGPTTTPSQPDKSATTPEVTTPTTTASAVPTDAVLRPGATGDSVVALQKALTALGHDPGDADGIFGAATQQAVVAFQKSEGLAEDGIAGAETLAAINDALAAG